MISPLLDNEGKFEWFRMIRKIFLISLLSSWLNRGFLAKVYVDLVLAATCDMLTLVVETCNKC